LRVGTPRRPRRHPDGVAPVAQHRRLNPQLLGDLHQRPATRRQQRDRLPLELVRVTPTRFRHQTPSCPFRERSKGVHQFEGGSRLASARERRAETIASNISIEDLNFGYRISGDSPRWRPSQVFDDGRKTYIQCPPNLGVTEAPPLFVLGSNGEAQLVNYRIKRNYYEVDRLIDEAELRLGESPQTIVRIERIEAAPAGETAPPPREGYRQVRQ
jgi:type IV secretion system protein VirB9